MGHCCLKMGSAIVIAILGCIQLTSHGLDNTWKHGPLGTSKVQTVAELIESYKLTGDHSFLEAQVWALLISQFCSSLVLELFVNSKWIVPTSQPAQIDFLRFLLPVSANYEERIHTSMFKYPFHFIMHWNPSTFEIFIRNTSVIVIICNHVLSTFLRLLKW